MIEENPFILAEKLFKLKLGELDEASKRELEQRLAEDETLRKIFDSNIESENLLKDLEQFKQFDANKAYEAALLQVYPSASPRMKPWYRWVAAACLVGAFGLVLTWLLRSYTDSGSEEILITKQALNEDQGVHLVLANGEHISADTLSKVLAGGTYFSADAGVLHIGQGLDLNAPEQAISASLSFHKIVVPYQQTYKVALPDGSLVHLNAGSTLSFPSDFGVNQRRVVLDGEAFFEVKPMPEKQFIVDAGSQQVKVYGTSFNVKAYNDEALHYTTLVHGKLSVTAAKQTEEHFIEPGYRASLLTQTGKFEVAAINLEHVASWKDGWLSFDNMPMHEILRQIGRWYNLDVVLLQPDLGEVQASGKIAFYPEVNDVLRKFELLGDIRFERVDNRILARRNSGK